EALTALWRSARCIVPGYHATFPITPARTSAASPRAMTSATQSTESQASGAFASSGDGSGALIEGRFRPAGLRLPPSLARVRVLYNDGHGRGGCQPSEFPMPF